MSATAFPINHAAVQDALLAALRLRYPGRVITVEWDERDALGDRAAAAADEDRVKDAA